MKEYVDQEKFLSEPRVSDEQRIKRWTMCMICPHLQGEYLGSIGIIEPDDKRKNCEVEGTTAFWLTQFKNCKCPLGKW